MSLSAVDTLSLAEVRAHVALLVRDRKAGDFRPLALLGRGEPGHIEVDGAPWDVVPVRGELDLRRALVEREGGDSLTVFLVDFTDQLPLDVSCRLRSNQVHRVTMTRRLTQRFGCNQIVPGLASQAVSRVVLTLPEGSITPVTHATLTADDLWLALLADRLVTTPPLDGATGWVTLAARGTGRDALVATLAAAPGLTAELTAWLGHEQRLGPAAAVVLDCWTQGKGQGLVAALMLLQAAQGASAAEGHTARLIAKMSVHKALGDEAVVAALVPCTADVLERLARDKAAFVGIQQQAEALFSEVPSLAARSRWLPSGYRSLADALGDALDAAAASADELPLVWSLVERLGAHHQRTMADHHLHTFAARLATWCAAHDARPLPPEQGTWTDILKVAQRYQREGGYVDWCRAHVRAHSTGPDPLDKAMRRLLARADARRDADDQRFATALLDWYPVRHKVTGVLPLASVTHKVVAPFLQAAEHRKLLVVLMDGMSRANLVQLLDGIENWGVVKQQDTPPVLASLPTLTGVSRSAFFAGRDHPSHAPGTEGDDPTRWRQNKAMQPFAGNNGPILLVKRDLKDDGVSAWSTAIASDDRVVGVIVNAVDDDLSGAQQLHAELTLAQVPILTKLLQLAANHKRAVLLVSDHGHVTGGRLAGRALPVGSEGGQRYRTLTPSQSPLHDELELPEEAWHAPAAPRMAAFWKEDAMWGSTKKGAHGGLSLAEVVVPCTLIAPTWLAHDLGAHDPGLETVPQEPPTWWSSAKVIPAPKAAPPPVQPPPQPDLFTPPEPPKPKPVPGQEQDRHPLVASLAETDAFKAACVEQTEDTVDLLLRALDLLLRAPKAGQLPLGQFAEGLGLSKARKVGPAVARMQFFQRDGIELLEANQGTQLVTLHVDRLKLQYGLSS